MTDLVILRLVQKGGQVAPECLLVQALDQVSVALLICKAVDKLSYHLGLKAHLKSEKFAFDLLRDVPRRIVGQYLHDKLLVTVKPVCHHLVV